MPILNSFNPSVAVNTGIDTITIPGHGLVNAQGVVYSNGNGSSIGGLVNGYKYYVIFVDSLTIKLANTEVEARANTSIDLLSTGSGTTHLLTTTTEYPNSAAYYDFFRKFRFIGTGIVDPEGYTIEADNVRDTLTIIGGTNIEFTQPQSGVNDTITINGPDYDLVSPTGVTNGAVVRLENVGVEYHDLKLTSFRGIRIERVATNEIEFESFGVTETDTLHTVSSRGNLTSNNLVMNNLLVGKIQSTPGIDGFINVSISSGDAYNGDGTLDNPLIFSPDESQRTDAAKTVTINFSAPSPGTFNYVAVYRSSAVLLSGYVRLERENPSTLVWETLDYTAGTLARTSYDIENIYAELDPGPINYRITFDWTGNTEFVNYRIRLTYEVEPIAGNEIILTDTDTEILTLGTSNGTVNLRGTIGVVETLNFDGLRIFQNNIDGNTSNSDINIRPNGTGDLVVTADTDILGDLIVRGGDITTDKTTFNLLNTTATTVNAFGAANTAVIATNASSIQLGNFTLNGSVIDTDDSSGITFVPVVTLNSDLNVENDIRVTQDVFVSGNTQITQDLSVSGNTQITQDLSVSGNTQLTQDLLINGSLTVGGGIIGNSTLTVDSNAVFNADVQIRGGDLTTDQTTFNLLNTTATTVNAFGSATVINVGALTGTTTVNNNLTVTGDLLVNGTTTTLNTATLDVEDLNITVAKGAINAAAANGAGLTVDGASATLLYASSNDSWNFNKLLTATSLQNTPIGTTTRAAGNFTSLEANGNVVLGDADTDTITVGGSFVTGTTLKSAKVATNTLALAAYDVDGTAYSNLITLTASNTPTLTLTSIGVGSLDNIDIGTTTRGSGKFTTLDANGNTIIGSDSADTATVNATITSNLIFTDNSYDIGATGATRPRSLFLSQNATLGGNLQVDGNTTIGNADTDTITVGGSFVTGTALRTAKTATNTLSLAAYDVDGTAYTNLITLTAGNTPSLALTSISTGSIDNMTIGGSTAAAGTFTNLTVSGLTTLAEITETLNTKTAATGVVTHDFSTGAIWYHSSISANFTVNLTNVPTTNDRIITVSLILNQGATGRLPSAFQIDGVAQTIRWQNNVTPTPNINIIEIATFSLVRTGSTWFVLGQLAPFA
jgi:predicted acyltransferase (DUF342 family)